MPSNRMMYDGMFLLSLVMALLETLAQILTGVGVAVIAVKMLKG